MFFRIENSLPYFNCNDHDANSYRTDVLLQYQSKKDKKSSLQFHEDTEQEISAKEAIETGSILFEVSLKPE